MRQKKLYGLLVRQVEVVTPGSEGGGLEGGCGGLVAGVREVAGAVVVVVVDGVAVGDVAAVAGSAVGVPGAGRPVDVGAVACPLFLRRVESLLRRCGRRCLVDEVYARYERPETQRVEVRPGFPDAQGAPRRRAPIRRTGDGAADRVTRRLRTAVLGAPVLVRIGTRTRCEDSIVVVRIARQVPHRLASRQRRCGATTRRQRHHHDRHSDEHARRRESPPRPRCGAASPREIATHANVL
mmetsp:Transcript_14129/g.42735  ORF Transcript_14129/g.42735 Transcript_14129/m.42735 type:complete len:239 (-) Transcript_14129:82-798(-)